MKCVTIIHHSVLHHCVWFTTDTGLYYPTFPSFPIHTFSLPFPSFTTTPSLMFPLSILFNPSRPPSSLSSHSPSFSSSPGEVTLSSMTGSALQSVVAQTSRQLLQIMNTKYSLSEKVSVLVSVINESVCVSYLGCEKVFVVVSRCHFMDRLVCVCSVHTHT